jgi:hypothetical protein
MAVLNGKLYFSRVQHSRLCILDSTCITANSNWQLAAGQSKTCSIAFLRVLCGKSPVFSAILFFSPIFSAPKCLRVVNGGQHAR